MSSQTVLEDASPVSRADRAVYAIERLLTLLSGLLILGVMLISVVNILGRKFKEWALDAELRGLAEYLGPVPGFVDWMVQAVPIIAFLGVAGCQRVGGHIRMDILVGLLKGRALWLFEFLTTLLMLALTLVLVWGSWLHFERSFDWSAPLWSRDSTIDINLPTWPVKLLVPAMLALLAVRFTIQAWAFGRAFITGAERPVAVPLIETAAEQAEAEARTVAGAEAEQDDAGQTEERR
ncbi:MAG: TRAP transporter small permease subunit [Pikeienuella sp.]